jgi:hypothetical protein
MTKVRILFLALFCAVFVYSAGAQTTILNVPNTDTLEKKQVYVEADFFSHLTPYSKGGYQNYGIRMVYGLRKKVEVGANFFYTHNGSRVPYEFQANLKWKAYENEKHGIAVSGGLQVFVPLNKPAGKRTYAMAYANMSKTFNKLKGGRVTVGVYQMIHAEKSFGNRKGMFFGYEQPIRRKLSFLADWYTGNNRFGYAAAGFGYVINRHMAIYAGYNFGNFGAGNNALSFYYGYTF